jgi:hypothetical protein
VAYFFTNDFFPFTRDDLKAFDPESYRVISDAWERPYEEASRPPVPRDIWRLIARDDLQHSAQTGRLSQ